MSISPPLDVYRGTCWACGNKGQRLQPDPMRAETCYMLQDDGSYDEIVDRIHVCSECAERRGRLKVLYELLTTDYVPVFQNNPVLDNPLHPGPPYVVMETIPLDEWITDV